MQHKRFVLSLRQEPFECSHLLFQMKQIALEKLGKNGWNELSANFNTVAITVAIDKKDSIIICDGKEIAWLEKSLLDPEIAGVPDVAWQEAD